MKVITPAIYQHFKHTDSGPLNNYMYVTIGVSEPVSSEYIREIASMDSQIIAQHTEIDYTLGIFYYNGKLYHTNMLNTKLVIYKSLYDNHIPYARPLELFTSRVDKDKYPNVKQKYRFKLVKY